MTVMTDRGKGGGRVIGCVISEASLSRWAWAVQGRAMTRQRSKQSQGVKNMCEHDCDKTDQRGCTVKYVVGDVVGML